jgi:hypothetical protein
MKIGRGNEGLREILPQRHLSSTNPTWLDPGLNPGRRGGKLATNRLSYGAAYPSGIFMSGYSTSTASLCHVISVYISDIVQSETLP